MNRLDDQIKKSKIDISDDEKSKLCLECMACCKILTFPIHYNLESTSFYLTRGLRLHYEHRYDMFVVEIPHVCPQLDEEHGCKLYKDRPDACKQFDGRNYAATEGVCKWPKLKEGD